MVGISPRPRSSWVATVRRHAIDIAQGAVFLGSDRSAQVSGLIMPIDAGATAGDPVSLIQQIMNARTDILAS